MIIILKDKNFIHKGMKYSNVSLRLEPMKNGQTFWIVILAGDENCRGSFRLIDFEFNLNT